MGAHALMSGVRSSCEFELVLLVFLGFRALLVHALACAMCALVYALFLVSYSCVALNCCSIHSSQIWCLPSGVRVCVPSGLVRT